FREIKLRKYSSLHKLFYGLAKVKTAYIFYKIELSLIFILSLLIIVLSLFKLHIPFDFIFELVIILFIILDKSKINMEYGGIGKFERINSIIHRISVSYVYFMFLLILTLLVLGEIGETENWKLSNTDFYVSKAIIFSFGVSATFYFIDSKCIEDYINKQFLKFYNTIPHWKFELVSILVISTLLSIEYMILMPTSFQLLQQKFLNPMAAIGISLVGIEGLFETIFIDKAELSISVINNHQLLKNDDTIDTQSRINVLSVIGTNQGRKSGSYKILGVCKKEEWPRIKENKTLITKLKQPIICYLKDGKEEPLQDRFENLDPGATTPIYYLKFINTIKEDFYIVFLEAPNHFVFREVKIISEKEKKSKKENLHKKKLINKVINRSQIFVVGLSVIILVGLGWYNRQFKPRIMIENKSYKYDQIELFKKNRIIPSKFKKNKIKIRTLDIYSQSKGDINGVIDLDLKIPNKTNATMVIANKAELLLKKNKRQYYLPNSMNYTVNANHIDVNARYLVNTKLTRATELKLKFILYDKSNTEKSSTFYITYQK
ncbi:hypothetical protein, partial [Lactobacillus kitasatonis]